MCDWNILGKRGPQGQGGSSQNFLKTLVDPAEPNVDVVAVHGLNPLNKLSHAEATWTVGDKLWLRDFLPKRAPQARVLLFSYNANVVFNLATAGVREQAENLLNQLAEKRIDNPDRPLVFVCHSLGGIIVKRAIVHAASDRTYEKIQASIFGIAFFGCPHRGGNQATLGNAVAKVARALLGKSGNSFIEALKRGSLFSDTISDDFRQVAEPLRFLSFYETKPLGRIGVVVDKRSATIGLPGTREKQIALDADHSYICRFGNDRDSTYRQVSDNIVRMIDDATSHRDEEYQGGAKPRISDNVSATKGERNTTIQAGHSNQSKTDGLSNKTNQFGNGNRSETYGNENSTTQISTTEMCIKEITEMFLPGKSR
ncbi:hypothetical protein RB595_008888 [Gaeumannomyces hyphopodioides]